LKTIDFMKKIKQIKKFLNKSNFLMHIFR